MQFPTPIPVETLAYAAAGAGALTVVAYILKIRRRRFEVPFSMLWQRVLENRDANALWKQLRRLFSLLLMLAILFVLFLAALNPTQGGMHAKARSVVVLIDTSASMKSTDGDPDRPNVTRIEVAKQKARELVDSMGGSDVAMIMRVDGQATPLSRFESDPALLHKVVDHIEAADTPADLYRALGAASDALRDRQNPLIVLISDGAYSDQQLASATFDPPAGTGAGSASGTDTAGSGSGSASDAEAGAGSNDEIAARRKSFEHEQLSKVDLSGIDVRYIPVGTRADNVGIVAFNVRRYIANKAAYEVFIEVQNFGTAEAHRQLTLYSGENPIDVQPITLAPGEKIRRIYPNLSGGTDHRLRASLRPVDGPGGSDPFALDDEAFALLPERKKQTVLLVTTDNLYLEGAMLVYDNIEVFKMTPDEYAKDPATALSKVQVVVFDDYTPAEIPPPPVNAIYFHPTGDGSPIPVVREVQHPPHITDIAEDHPVMRWVTLNDVNFDSTEVFAPRPEQSEATLASSVRDPIIASRRESGRKILCFGFSLGATDLTLRVAFPLLLVNSLDWFAGDDADLVTTYVTGRPLRVPLDGVVGVAEAEVQGPDGKLTRAPVADGVVTFYGAKIGFHDIHAYAPGVLPPIVPTEDKLTVPPAPPGAEPIASREIAANLSSPEESDIQPASQLTLGGKQLEAPEAFAVTTKKEFWTLLLAGFLILLGLEWITYHRRVTV